MIEAAMVVALIYYRTWEVGVVITVFVVIRRAPWLANAIADMLSLDDRLDPDQYIGMTACFIGVVRWVARLALPAWDGGRGVMSHDEDEEAVRVLMRTGSDDVQTSSPDPVRPQQNQLEPAITTVREPPAELQSLHRMTRVEEIAMLAVQRNADGGYRHSANDILKLMGGTAAEVKEQIAAIRGPSKPAPQPSSVARPKSGWGR